MSALTVTLNDIRKHNPCVESWEKLLASLGKTKDDNTPVAIEYILDLLGVADALWALRALPESMDNSVRLLICDLVEPALQYTDDPSPAEAVAVARRYARGEATRKELDAASDATWAATRAAAVAGSWAATRAAARAAVWAVLGDAALAAIWAAASAAPQDAPQDAARAEQETMLREWIKRMEGES